MRTVEHAYDIDGTRVRNKTTPSGGTPEVVDYLVDTSGLSQVVAESNAGGAVTALHVRKGEKVPADSQDRDFAEALATFGMKPSQ